MILIFGGTTEANQIAELLVEKGKKVTVSCATTIPLTARIESQASRENPTILTGRLDKNDIINLLAKNKFKAVIDATHPFALQISQNAKEACELTNIPYYRLEREAARIPNNSLIFSVPNFKEAAKQAVKLGSNIFLTIGVNNIDVFIGQILDCISANNIKITARVLNNESSIQKCLEADIEKNNIIAENGPFSTTQNIDHFLQHNAEVIVSKDSGIVGGLNEKIKACEQLKLPLVIIKRPAYQKKAFFQVEELIEQLEKN